LVHHHFLQGNKALIWPPLISVSSSVKSAVSQPSVGPQTDTIWDCDADPLCYNWFVLKYEMCVAVSKPHCIFAVSLSNYESIK